VRRRIRLVAGAVVLLVVAAAAGYVLSTTGAPAGRHRTARVERGAVVASVSATGTLAAVTTVQVGSQVSGQIKELLADFNSPVRRGQLIARLDPDLFQARVNAARAEVESAQAQVLNQRANVEKVRADVENARAGAVTAEANVEKVRADVENARAAIATAQANVAREGATAANARRELDRRIDLLGRDLVAQSEKDQAQTAFETASAQLEAARAQERAGQAAVRSAQAQLAAVESQARAARAQVASVQAALAVAEAQLKAAEATVRQKQAALEQARLDLERTEIRAPVDGVVVSRSIDVGQTVAASLQAPTLFTIAQDLTRMQVETAIDEADVGRLREGMPATFGVDAFPGQTFRGEIVQIRKAAQVIQNVVSYTTVIAVANPARILLPGMTANVRIQVDRREDVLRVPNAALRYRPPGEAEAPGPSSPAASPAGPPASTAGGPGTGAVAGREQREALVRELGLSADQQVRLDGILAEARQAFMAVRAQGLDERAAQVERRRLRGEVREKIRAMLTPEQQKKYEALTAAQDGAGAPGGTPARVYVGGPDGKPRAVAIVVGISDGSYSEVLSGELAAGQEVIVGQPPSSGARPGQSSGPRLRL
jgi:HlyD family secretion protein